MTLSSRYHLLSLTTFFFLFLCYYLRYERRTNFFFKVRKVVAKIYKTSRRAHVKKNKKREREREDERKWKKGSGRKEVEGRKEEEGKKGVRVKSFFFFVFKHSKKP